ncbi:MAG: SDR family NAD(P)-dependent oxidoreductase [Paracoccaceae bacterium]|nr:SDR family NAD(P)-dependent oxidoreductase [Paracoccaceae bacterium]
MTTWIILGGTSTIARAFARKAADRGEGVILAGRDADDLAATAADCAARGAPLGESIRLDARDPLTFGPIAERAGRISDEIGIAVFVGSMPSQEEIDSDPALIDGVVADNYSGPARLLHELAPLLEDRGAGTVIGVGSVAGDRGRIGNYVYGSSKSGFHAYLSGLRNRLGRSGVHVVTVKPGTVDTAMTWGMEKLPFLAPPEKIVQDIFRAADKKKDVIYTPLIWWPVMTVIRAIPERVFKKMSI